MLDSAKFLGRLSAGCVAFATADFLSWPAIIFLVPLAIVGCGRHEGSPADTSSQLVRRSVGSEPSSLDPQQVGDTFSFEVLRDLFEGLTAESATGETVPGTADNWSVSEGGKRYRFHLRPDARWSNGTPVEAGDFVRGLRRAVDPATRSPNASLLALVLGAPDVVGGRAPPDTLGVRAIDPRTLEIDLSAPAPYFPAILSNPIAYPRLPAPPGPPGDPPPSRLASNGAYQLVKWVPGGGVTLERNRYYWDANNVAIPRVEFVAIADSNTELSRYRAGQIDLTSFVPAQQLETLKRERPSELQIRAQLAVVYYAFNLTRPMLRDGSGLREAMSLAIDRERLVESVLKGGQLPAFGFVPPGIGNYEGASYHWRNDTPALRIQHARAVFHAAGFSEQRPLHLKLLCPEDDTLRRVALAVTAMWHEVLGIEAAPVFLEYRAFLAAREQRADWDVISHGWNADYPDPGDFLGIFTSASPQNDARLADQEFDRLMAAAAGEADGEKRLALLAHAERRLLDDYVVAPIYYAVSRRLVSPRLEGAVLSPMNHNYTKYLSLRRQ